MKQTTIITTTIIVATIVFAMLAATFWILWTREEEKSVKQSAITPQQIVIKREDLQNALIAELKRTKGDLGHLAYDVEVHKEDDKWMVGNLLAYYSEQKKQPEDPYFFLATKNQNGDITDLAFIYSDKFVNWLPSVPENIIPKKAHQYLGGKSYDEKDN